MEVQAMVIMVAQVVLAPAMEVLQAIVASLTKGVVLQLRLKLTLLIVMVALEARVLVTTVKVATLEAVALDKAATLVPMRAAVVILHQLILLTSMPAPLAILAPLVTSTLLCMEALL